MQHNDNATRAAEAIGHKPGRASEQAGYRLSKDVVVQRLLAQRRAEALEKAKATSDEVLVSAARDMRFDPAKLFDEHGKLKPIHEIDEDTRLAMRGMDVDQILGYADELEGKGNAKKGEKGSKVVIGHTVKVRFPEKTAAREQLMKHFGLYEKDNRQRPAIPPILVKFV